jgi:hypothetical protein
MESHVQPQEQKFRCHPQSATKGSRLRNFARANFRPSAALGDDRLKCDIGADLVIRVPIRGRDFDARGECSFGRSDFTDCGSATITPADLPPPPTRSVPPLGTADHQIRSLPMESHVQPQEQKFRCHPQSAPKASRGCNLASANSRPPVALGHDRLKCDIGADLVIRGPIRGRDFDARGECSFGGSDFTDCGSATITPADLPSPPTRSVPPLGTADHQIRPLPMESHVQPQEQKFRCHPQSAPEATRGHNLASANSRPPVALGHDRLKCDIGADLVIRGPIRCRDFDARGECSFGGSDFTDCGSATTTPADLPPPPTRSVPPLGTADHQIRPLPMGSHVQPPEQKFWSNPQSATKGSRLRNFARANFRPSAALGDDRLKCDIGADLVIRGPIRGRDFDARGECSFGGSDFTDCGSATITPADLPSPPTRSVPPLGTADHQIRPLPMESHVQPQEQKFRCHPQSAPEATRGHNLASANSRPPVALGHDRLKCDIGADLVIRGPIMGRDFLARGGPPVPRRPPSPPFGDGLSSR